MSIEELIYHIVSIQENLEQVQGQTDWDCELLECALQHLYKIREEYYD